MASEPSLPNLAANLGLLHQTRGTGELVLEQNDGVRRLYLKDGRLCYLRSDAVGEQFGNYLIRLGVLDYMKRTSILRLDPEQLRILGPAAIVLAKSEGLEAHARSVAIRLNLGDAG